VSHVGGPIPPPSPLYGGVPSRIPPPPGGFFGRFRGVNPLNEIFGNFLRGVCVAEFSGKIFGKLKYL